MQSCYFLPGMGSQTQPSESLVLLKSESLRNSITRNVKIHDLPETDDLTLFILKALKALFLSHKLLFCRSAGKSLPAQ